MTDPSPNLDVHQLVQRADATYTVCGTLDPHTTGVLLAIARQTTHTHQPVERVRPARLCSHPRPSSGKELEAWRDAHPEADTELLPHNERERGKRVCPSEKTVVCKGCTNTYDCLIVWPCDDWQGIEKAVAEQTATQAVPEVMYWVNGPGGRVIASTNDGGETVLYADQYAEVCAGVLNSAYQSGRTAGLYMDGRPVYQAAPTGNSLAIVTVDDRVTTNAMWQELAAQLAAAARDAWSRGLDDAERAVLLLPCSLCHAPGGTPCTPECLPTAAARARKDSA
ncbi:hypothetical protein [Nocardiopsis synnemataformans]|uniref:hypothetical protein n=1 Tax=Nocardiopsis synnemataformans TaxID=61305 RepID=UPI003EB835F0